jgi:Tol biopolymer transport system component
MITPLIVRLVPLGAAALVIACATEAGQLPSDISAASLRATDEPAQFSDWAAPTNLGPMANSTQGDMHPALSKDGLSIYFGRGAASGAFDVWVSQRAGVDDPWGTAQNSGSTINTDRGENQPTLSVDGHRLFFNSDRLGGVGGQDLYVSRRRDKRDNFDWETAVNLGSGVNTGANEVGPALFEDDEAGTIVLYFASNRPGGLGGNDIYASRRLADGTFSAPVRVVELSSASDDNAPGIRRDGLEVFITSDRSGTLGGTDLWVATRAGTSEQWSTPVNLGPMVNTSFNDGGAALSRDGTTLYFHSNANRLGNQGPCFGELGPCNFDSYVTTRSKLRGRAVEEVEFDR